MARLNFDARTVAPDTGVAEAIPAGWYNVVIDESDMKPTSGGDGAFLECRYTVLDGQYKGRKIFSRFNLRNNNAKAVEIAYGQLSALCHAVGVLLCEDSQLLHNIPLKVKVSVRAGGPKLDKVTGQPTGETYEPSNDIKAWKNINEPVDTAVAAPAPAHAPSAAPAGWGAPVAAPAAAPAPWAAPATAPAQPAAPAGGAPWGMPPAGGAQPPQAAPAYGANPQYAPAPAQPATQFSPPPAQPPVQPPAAPPMAPPWGAAPAGGAPMAPPWAAGGAPATPPWGHGAPAQ